MPYSPELGIVFVAIPKTGTTSITRALKVVSKERGGLQLLNEHIDKPFRKKYKLNKIGDKKPGHAKHLSAIQLKYILGEEEFERCTTFSVVRNPWARMASRYFFTRADNEPTKKDKIRRGTTRSFHDMEFERWLERIYKRHRIGKRKNSQIIKLQDLEGNLIVDRVGKLEDVQSTLDWVSETSGADRMKMPHVNGTRKGDYAQFYNDVTREMVAEVCREDVEGFGYVFGE
ncbi:MAG: chondroitin 4-sulfotransferase 11 [Bacteroidia bacterium]|jgi:chondroitin 4-sulfotransferase 11